MLLEWKQCEYHEEAKLGSEELGFVTFSLSYHPSCHRRGPWRLFVEVDSGPHHYAYGCFDDQDQPMRYFHKEANARDEAEMIADVLLAERTQQVIKGK